MSTARRPRGPTDHQRAATISRATFQVVKARGIAALTHRAVAEQAGVPLGSTTYHYANREALLAAALHEAIGQFEALISAWSVGLTRENVPAKLAELLAAQSAPGELRDQMLIEYELYLAAVRSSNLRALSIRWDGVLRDVLQAHVGEPAGRIFFAAYNGFILESLISDEPLDHLQMEVALRSIQIT